MGRDHRTLAWLLTLSVVFELLLLRTATRTLIHIPGTDRFETVVRLLAEGGRVSYYVAALCLVIALLLVGRAGIRTPDRRRVAAGLASGTFLVVAAAGRLEVVAWTTVGWVSLATLVTAAVAGWRGLRSVPVGLFLVGSVAAGTSVLGQTISTPLAGGRIEALIWVSEIFLVLAGVTAPLLLRYPPTRAALYAGVAATLVVAGSASSSSSTMSILLLWNVGVPGWLPGLAYAIAVGALTATLWSAVARGEGVVVAGIILLVAGGVGTISTYQTGLVLMAVLTLGGLGGDVFAEPPAAEVPNPAGVTVASPVGVS
ncbi:MAG: hypothetical protein WD532_11210 [Acidimicrobiia bacterium]